MDTKDIITYEEYIKQVNTRLNLFEQASAKMSTLDDRIDMTNRLLIQIASLMAKGIQVNLPPVNPFPGRQHYNVLRYKLDAIRAEPGEEINVTGDTITAYTNGSLANVYIRLDTMSNDPIPLGEFNPYHYRTGFQRFWLQTDVQSGKYLRLHIGREAGAEAATQIIVVQTAQSSFVHSQVSVGTSAVQLSDTSVGLKVGVVIKADDGNTDSIYIGNSNSVTTATGMRLTAAQFVDFEIDDLNKVWVIGGAAGQEVQYLGI